MAGAAPPPVALVQGTSSMPNAGERRYGVSVTQRLSRWLEAIPIAHTTLTDETLSDDSLRAVSVLILGYNPNPTPGAPQMRKEPFSEIVFYIHCLKPPVPEELVKFA